MKRLAIVVIFILICFASIYYFFKTQNISLPYMRCGGSTLQALANKCVKGFSCQPDLTPNCAGCGGICRPK